jgi:hypothetical protein
MGKGLEGTVRHDQSYASVSIFFIYCVTRAIHYGLHLMLFSLQGLLLGPVGLGVLEGKAAGALVEAVVLADHGRVAGEHDTIEAEDGERGAPDAAEHVARLAGPAVAGPAVEGAGGVVEEGDEDNGAGVWGDAVGRCWGVNSMSVRL